ncbi:Predicted regulator of Ras-like GTPase activity, Roadblock/LC7/MglB family [Streptomyces sp. AmelKG-E11A]|nr:Predicted regulator of Ras-like GTPase activity, Roadblock/LC7/MglB family [Streptomyces sp. AmelKG-E11A]
MTGTTSSRTTGQARPTSTADGDPATATAAATATAYDAAYPLATYSADMVHRAPSPDATTTVDDTFTWLLEDLLARTPGARHALVLSRDGLKLCRTPELSVDQADQLAAIAAGIHSLSHGASVEFGNGGGGVRSAMAEFHGGVLFIVEAGQGAHVAVIADEDAEAGTVGRHMSELVGQLGAHLSADAPTVAAAVDHSRAPDGARSAPGQ